MYVTVTNLREAIQAEITRRADHAVKTSEELLEELTEKTHDLQKWCANRARAHIETNLPDLAVTYDMWVPGRVSVSVSFDGHELAYIANKRAEIDELRTEMMNARSAARNRLRSVPTPTSELEAWLVRLDQDVKTATVAIKREFANELGMV
jgi:DnaJ-domain-containing protein 1